MTDEPIPGPSTPLDISGGVARLVPDVGGYVPSDGDEGPLMLVVLPLLLP